MTISLSEPSGFLGPVSRSPRENEVIQKDLVRNWGKLNGDADIASAFRVVNEFVSGVLSTRMRDIRDKDSN